MPKGKEAQEGVFWWSLNPKLRHGRLHPSLKIGRPQRGKDRRPTIQSLRVFLLLQNKQTSVFCGSLKWGSTFFKGCLCVLCELFGGYTVASDFTVPVGNLEVDVQPSIPGEFWYITCQSGVNILMRILAFTQIKWIASKKMWLSWNFGCYLELNLLSVLQTLLCLEPGKRNLSKRIANRRHKAKAKPGGPYSGCGKKLVMMYVKICRWKACKSKMWKPDCL